MSLGREGSGDSRRRVAQMPSIVVSILLHRTRTILNAERYVDMIRSAIQSLSCGGCSRLLADRAPLSDAAEIRSNTSSTSLSYLLFDRSHLLIHHLALCFGGVLDVARWKAAQHI